MNGNGLVHTRAQLIQRPRQRQKGIHIGEQQRAVHAFGKAAYLLAKLRQLVLPGQAATADGLQAHHKALIINTGNRLGYLKAVV